MNDELQNALTEIIEKSLGAVSTASNFLSAELPEVIQQLLLWKMAESLVVNLVALGFLSAYIFLVKYCVKKITAMDDWEDGVQYVFAPILAAIPISFAFFSLNIVFLQIWIAPKVYLIEYVSSLAK